MSQRYRVAIIGCGNIARAHVNGYLENGSCEIVACSDINLEAAKKFVEQYQVGHHYSDYKEMIAKIQPDIVSICTYHHLHYEMTMAAAAYKPQAIYCEKPIALHLHEADEMVEVCRKNNIKLIIGHQRRYAEQFSKAKEILSQGAIGQLYHMEAYGHPWSSLLVDGTHYIDLLRFFNDDVPVDWVMGQVDTKFGSFRFGHPNEGASLSMFHFRNGVRATMTTGGFSITCAPYPAKDGEGLGAPVPPKGYVKFILHGTEGRMEIDGDDAVNGQPILRIHRGKEVESVAVDYKNCPTMKLVVDDLLHQIELGKEHRLTGQSARNTLEVIVAIYQSSKDRALVYMPLEIGINPLFEIITDQNPK